MWILVVEGVRDLVEVVDRCQVEVFDLDLDRVQPLLLVQAMIAGPRGLATRSRK